MNTKLIQRWMDREGHTRADLAYLLKIHPTTLWRRMTGKVKPDYAFLVMLSRMMGKTINEISKEEK